MSYKYATVTAQFLRSSMPQIEPDGICVRYSGEHGHTGKRKELDVYDQEQFFRMVSDHLRELATELKLRREGRLE